jgi:hypothetical protein
LEFGEGLEGAAKQMKSIRTFSLRTLLIATLLIGSAGALYVNSPPWHALPDGPEADDVDVSADKKRVLTVLRKENDADEVSVLDFMTLAPVCHIRWKKFEEQFQTYRYVNDDRWILAASYSTRRGVGTGCQHARLFDANTGLEIAGPGNDARYINVPRGGRFVVAYFHERPPEIWEPGIGLKQVIDLAPVERFYDGVEVEISDQLFFTSDGSKMLGSNMERTAIWRTKDSEMLEVLQGLNGLRGLAGLLDKCKSTDERNLTRDGKKILYDSGDGLGIFDFETQLDRKFAIKGAILEDNTFSPDGTLGLSIDGLHKDGQRAQTAYLFDVKTERVLSDFPMITASWPRARWTSNRVLFRSDVSTENFVINLDHKTKVPIPNAVELSNTDRALVALKDSYGIADALTGEWLCSLPSKPFGREETLGFSEDGNVVAAFYGKSLKRWTRHHPEQWWGIAWLPETWITLAICVFLYWSVQRDKREIRN